LAGIPQLWWLAKPLNKALWTRSAGNSAFRAVPLGNDAFDAREHQAYRRQTPGEHRWNCKQRNPPRTALPQKQEAFHIPPSDDKTEQPSCRIAW